MKKIVVACIAALLLLSACGEQPENTKDPDPVITETETAAPALPSAAVPEPTETAPELPPVTDPPVTEAPPPVELTGAPVTNTPDPPPEEPPGQPASLGDAEFADAAFLGNSLVDGLRVFGGLEQGEFFAIESASVVNVGTLKNTTLCDGEEASLLEALCEREHGKIFVLLGINEISFAPEYFVQLYSGVVDTILEKEPGAEIYVMSLTPVTKAKNDEGSYFTMEAVNAYNDALRALAEARGFHYIDLVDALAGEDGFLPEEDSTDGIHLKREVYPVWAEYLRTHI